MAKAKKVEQNVEDLPAVEEGPRMARKVTGIEPSASLTILAEDNPKRANSKAYDTFAIYLETRPATVQEALDNGIGMDHIKYDHLHGFIEVDGAEVVEYEVKPRGPRDESDAEGEEVAADGDGF